LPGWTSVGSGSFSLRAGRHHASDSRLPSRHGLGRETSALRIGRDSSTSGSASSGSSPPSASSSSEKLDLLDPHVPSHWSRSRSNPAASAQHLRSVLGRIRLPRKRSGLSSVARNQTASTQPRLKKTERAFELRGRAVRVLKVWQEHNCKATRESALPYLMI